MNEQQIVSSMFAQVEWINEYQAFMPCPGAHLHTGKNSKRDCKIHLDAPPTITCFHSSCSTVIEEVNYKMRRALWEGSPKEKRVITEKEKVLIRKQMQERKKLDDLEGWAKKNKASLLLKNQWPLADVFEGSPFKTNDPADDWKFIGSLFNADDVIWNGDVKDSGELHHKGNFLPVSLWLQGNPKGNFTCPSVFKPDTFSRCNADVIRRPFLVVESDDLSKEDCCAIFKWMTQFMTLRAIVDTGGKSVHGWFDFPKDSLLKKLKVILPALGCDKALFKPSQPVRMPGVMRVDKLQHLLYFNPKPLTK